MDIKIEYIVNRKAGRKWKRHDVIQLLDGQYLKASTGNLANFLNQLKKMFKAPGRWEQLKYKFGKGGHADEHERQ